MFIKNKIHHWYTRFMAHTVKPTLQPLWYYNHFDIITTLILQPLWYYNHSDITTTPILQPLFLYIFFISQYHSTSKTDFRKSQCMCKSETSLYVTLADWFTCCCSLHRLFHIQLQYHRYHSLEFSPNHSWGNLRQLLQHENINNSF